MGNKTKIVVLHLKEVIYTAVFALLAILFVVLLVVMFFPEKENLPETTSESERSLYQPGVYHHSLSLGTQTVDIEVTVDDSNINNIRLINLNEDTETMYPLLEPAFEDLVQQILTAQSLDGLTYSDNAKYTSLVLLDGIRSALSKADPAAE